MKTLLQLISIILYCQITFAQLPGTWSEIDPGIVNNDPTVQNALIFGARFVIERGIEDGPIIDADYDITKIISVRQQTPIVDGISYEFNVEMLGNDGTADFGYFVGATYVVFVQNGTNAMEVSYWEYYTLDEEEAKNHDENGPGEFEFLPEEVYVAEEDNEVAGDWTQVDSKDLNSDPDLQSAFNFGLEQAIERSINNGSLPPQTYQEEEVYIQKQIVSDGNKYRFDVMLQGDGGAQARVIFDVHSELLTAKQELLFANVISVD